MWKLIPIAAEEVVTPPQPWHELFNLGPFPQYDPGNPPVPIPRMGFKRDEFGMVVTEVTIVTTRKRYPIEDA